MGTRTSRSTLTSVLIGRGNPSVRATNRLAIDTPDSRTRPTVTQRPRAECALCVNETTIKSHMNHLLAKTGVRNRAQAITYAYRHRLSSRHFGDASPPSSEQG